MDYQIVWADDANADYVELKLPSTHHVSQGQCIPDGVAANVVVEINVYVFALGGPFANAVSSPAQFIIGVGASIKRMPIGPVQPDVNERSRCPQDARQVSATHNAVANPAPFEQVENSVLMPARVSELYSGWHPVGQ
jgi:hypothetical protein